MEHWAPWIYHLIWQVTDAETVFHQKLLKMLKTKVRSILTKMLKQKLGEP